MLHARTRPLVKCVSFCFAWKLHALYTSHLLVCTSAVRNCLECRHRYQAHGSEPPSPSASKGANGIDPIQSLIGGSHPSAKVSLLSKKKKEERERRRNNV